MIEEQDKIVSYLSVATRGSKVRDSDVYDETLRDFGYDGSGVVIAVLDSGVDNEHFSLDDFSDTLHDEIVVQARGAGLTVELLDAKGEILYE